MSAKFPRGGGANPFSAIRLYVSMMSEQLLTVLKWRYAYAPLMSEQLLIVLNGAMPMRL